MNAIRLATTADAASILEIYKPFILNSAITFETEVPSVSAFAQRIQTYLETWPWLVYEVDRVVAGYAYAAKHRERAAYQWCVESSVYVHPGFYKRGIATSLYEKLFKILKYQGFINVYAVITLPNDKSISFHKDVGFSHFADYKNIGFKLNKWHTVSWWELQMNDYPADAHDPIKLPLVEKAFLADLLNSE